MLPMCLEYGCAILFAVIEGIPSYDFIMIQAAIFPIAM